MASNLITWGKKLNNSGVKKLRKNNGALFLTKRIDPQAITNVMYFQLVVNMVQSAIGATLVHRRRTTQFAG